MSKKEKELSLEDLKKEFGKETIGLFNDVYLEPQSIPTGSIKLDDALNGGWKTTKIHELWGLNASGKSCLVLHAIAEAQKMGGTAAFIDAEQTFDPVFAARFGVNVDELILVKPDNGEQVFDITEKLVKAGTLLIGIDSVSAMVPASEAERSNSQNSVGSQARMMSQGLRKLTPIVGKHHSAVIFINQVREKVGVMFGNPQTTSGGNALAFYASVRLEVSAPKSGWIIPAGEEARIGHNMKIKIVKSKVGKPAAPVSFDVLYFEGGIDKVGEVCDLAEAAGILTRSGAWYAYGGDNIGQGRTKTIQFLKENPAVYSTIRDEIVSLVESLNA